MISALMFLIVSLFILGLGAELMVRGSTSLALKLGVTPLLIGLTVVAFGTSAPELAVSIESTLSGRSSLALGNVVGSNIANIGLILGLIAVIRPIQIEQELVRKQIPLMIASSILLWFLLLDGQLGLFDGIILVAGLIGFLLFSYRQAVADDSSKEMIASSPLFTAPKKPLFIYLLMLLIGIAMLVYGSVLFVENAVTLARLMGVSEAVIGLSIVAVGTSIPELATSLASTFKNQHGLAVGNVVGSNLFNILGIMGIAAIVGTVSSREFNLIDFGVMIAYAFILLPFAWTNLQISRKEGVALLAGYFAYMIYLFP